MINKETALMVRERAESDGLTVDEFLNKLMSPAPQGVWSTCALCEKKIKTVNMARHMAQVHPRAVGVGKP
jgi:hypothetical protein